MNRITIGKTEITAPAVIVGGMRLVGMEDSYFRDYIKTAVNNGLNYFDYADIYADGEAEAFFGRNFKKTGIMRRDVIIQSKCGICKGYYDASKSHITESVDGILKRLQTDYLDVLLLHRPDALTEPQEVAEAVDDLYKMGKIRYFGVSNHNPYQIELLKKYLKVPIVINQLQFSLAASGMISSGMEVNMTTSGAFDRDGHVLDYCRLNDITIQAWSPLQIPDWKGCFIDNKEYAALNGEMEKTAAAHNTSKSVIAAAWILRHPAKMQVICGSSRIERLLEMAEACNINLSRSEWYGLYLVAGHILP